MLYADPQPTSDPDPTPPATLRRSQRFVWREGDFEIEVEGAVESDPPDETDSESAGEISET